MRHGRSRSTAVALGLCLAALPLVAQTTFFKWIDAKGNLHVTDRLADVPEPYYSMYLAKLRELEEERAKAEQTGAAVAPIAAPKSPAAAPQAVEPREAMEPSVVELELKRQADWKALVAKWRGELAQATADVERLQNQTDEKSLNPILRETPDVKTQLVELEALRVRAMVRLERARKMLLEDLPARARAEGVPPKWLD